MKYYVKMYLFIHIIYKHFRTKLYRGIITFFTFRYQVEIRS